MTTAIQTASGGYALSLEDATTLEAVVAKGDLSKLTPEQRTHFYMMRCESAGLDPRTQPFQYIVLQGKLTLYATKTATEQLCEKRNISTGITNRERDGEAYVVQCRASLPTGRFTDASGAVTIGGLKGDAYCNALMKAETKAKRRAVLALCGLGMLDETETETIPGASIAPQMQAPSFPEKAQPLEAQDMPHYELDVSTKMLRMALDEIKADYPYHPQKRAIVEELRKRKEQGEPPVVSYSPENYGNDHEGVLEAPVEAELVA